MDCEISYFSLNFMLHWKLFSISSTETKLKLVYSSRHYLGQCSTKCKHFPGYCHVQVILVYSKLLKFGVLVNKHGYYIYQNVHLPKPPIN